MVRSIRFKMFGYLIAAALIVMPRGVARDLFKVAVENWMNDTAEHLIGHRPGYRLRRCLE